MSALCWVTPDWSLSLQRGPEPKHGDTVAVSTLTVAWGRHRKPGHVGGMQRAKAELRCGQAAQEPFLAALVLLVRVSLTWRGWGTLHTPLSLKCRNAALAIRGVLQTFCSTHGWDRMSDK